MQAGVYNQLCSHMSRVWKDSDEQLQPVELTELITAQNN